MKSKPIYPIIVFYLLVFPLCDMFFAAFTGDAYVPVLICAGIFYCLVTMGLYVATFLTSFYTAAECRTLSLTEGNSSTGFCTWSSAIVFNRDEDKAVSHLLNKVVLYPFLSYCAATFTLYAAGTVTAISARALSDCTIGFPLKYETGPTPCQTAGVIPDWIIPALVVSGIITLIGLIAITAIPCYMRKIPRNFLNVVSIADAIEKT